jgi:hypothetical protein
MNHSDSENDIHGDPEAASVIYGIVTIFIALGLLLAAIAVLVR